MKRFVDMGVDSVITNRPDACLKLLQGLGRR
jgi:glycerophosphoryl diester phosphodiesterase